MSISTPSIHEPVIPRHYSLVVVEVVAELNGINDIVAEYVYIDDVGNWIAEGSSDSHRLLSGFRRRCHLC